MECIMKVVYVVPVFTNAKFAPYLPLEHANLKSGGATMSVWVAAFEL